MKYSLNWLREFVALPDDLSAEALSGRLMELGLETASLVRLGPDFTGVTVAEVLEVRPHPNADRLRLCEVTDGAEKLSVVCGAPNVAKGQRVPLAKVGARLPGDFVIRRSKIRGEVSEGMLCSGKELGTTQDADGILVFPADAPLGRDVSELLGGRDTVLELEVTPNRADVLSHLGLARELAWTYGLPLKDPALEPGPGRGEPFPVEVRDPEACPRYLGRSFTGLKVGPSPAWLAARLTACGLRPINNLVDVTNFVLLERGQPLHAFDQALLRGRVEVRRARHGETLKALDGREYVLDEEDLVVADEARALALAGVIGGEETGVTGGTTTAFLECASFAPRAVRHTARRLRVRTDSSYRFERGVDPEGVPAASRRAARLILELCGGAATAERDAWRRAERAPVRLSRRGLDDALGLAVPPAEAEAVLRGLDPGLRADGEGWLVAPPSWRADLGIEADLVEEVGRHLGYERIPMAPGPAPANLAADPPERQWASSLRRRAVGLGFLEALNYDFVSEKELAQTGLPSDGPRLANPISQDWVFLRPSLLPGLLRSARHNARRGASCLRLFEVGKTYWKGGERAAFAALLAGDPPPHWAKAPEPLGLSEAKGVAEALLGGLLELESAPASHPVYHPKLCLELRRGSRALGRLGRLHPAVVEAWDAPDGWALELDLGALPGEPPWFRPLAPISPYPVSNRDLSIVLEEGVPWEAVEKAVRAGAGPGLAALSLIDVFRGKGIPEGSRSLTLRLTLASPERTLSEEDIQGAVDRVLERLKPLGARLRS